jgi:hypothetical protein
MIRKIVTPGTLALHDCGSLFRCIFRVTDSIFNMGPVIVNLSLLLQLIWKIGDHIAAYSFFSHALFGPKTKPGFDDQKQWVG